jgi:transcriptional regulator NrdR family protein
MAKEEIGFNVTVGGVEKSISSFKDLKTAIKAAKDEQIAMSEKFGEGSVEATKAGQKLAGLQDKVGDLNDATKSLTGSGIEKLTSSFRLLGEGIATFDFDKIKTGFGGIGAAMSAIPIFLIIKGLEYLYENFDKVKALLFDTTDEVKNNKEALEALQKQQDASKKSLDDYIGSLEKELETLKLTNASIEDQVKLRQKITGVQVASIDEQIKKQEALIEVTKKEIIQNEALLRQSQLRAASTSSSYESEITNQNRVLDNTLKNQKTALEALRAANVDKASVIAKGEDDIKKINQPAIDAANKLREKRLEDEKRLLADIEKAKEESYLRSLKSDEARSVAKAQFDNDKLIEDVNKSKAHQSVKDESLKQISIKLESDLLIIKNDFQGKRDVIDKAAQVKKDAEDTAFRTKQLSDADIDNKKWVANYLSNKESAYQLELEGIENNDLLKLQKEQEHLDVVYQMNIDTVKLLGTNKLDIDNKYAKDKIALEKKIAAETKKIKQDEIKQGFENVKNGLNAAQGLSDIYFTIKSAKVKGDAAKEEALARKQFNIQKAFNLAKVGMDGYMAISNIIATTPKVDFGISTGILLAASAISTAANLAKIGAAQFEGGASAPATSPESAASIPSTTSQAPAIYGPGQGQSTTFTGNQNNNFGPVKAYVVETENRSTTNRVNKLVSESTYG